MMPIFESRNEQFDRVFLNIAREISKLSRCERLKVGAIIVKDNNILSFGYNGTPSGRDNICEIYDPTSKELTTKSEVLHAESNAILKIAKSTYSSEGAILYQTLSPCFECAKLIIQAGIKKVVYIDEYRNIDGLEFLKECDIEIIQNKDI